MKKVFLIDLHTKGKFVHFIHAAVVCQGLVTVTLENQVKLTLESWKEHSWKITKAVDEVNNDVTKETAEFAIVKLVDGDVWLRGEINEALGSASMCWSETPKGVFVPELANKIGEELFEKMKKVYPKGCA